MNIYKVTSNSVAFDEDESMIISAKCEGKAVELAKEQWTFRDGRSHCDFTVLKLELVEYEVLHIAHFGN